MNTKVLESLSWRYHRLQKEYLTQILSAHLRSAPHSVPSTCTPYHTMIVSTYVRTSDKSTDLVYSMLQGTY